MTVAIHLTLMDATSEVLESLREKHDDENNRNAFIELLLWEHPDFAAHAKKLRIKQPSRPQRGGTRKKKGKRCRKNKTN